MTPTIDGKVHNFAEHGLYDGLFLMRDEESGTFWDHLTGEAVYGELVGKTLNVGLLNYSLAGQVLENEPDALITLSDQSIRENDDMELESLAARQNAGLSGMFSSTIRAEDPRLPTMALGVGVWQGQAGRFYPYDSIVNEGDALIDDFDGRTLVVLLDPAVQVLSAYYVESREFEWEGEVLRFGDGSYLENSILHDRNGKPQDADRPLQIFTRWYGFALTFPGTEIYGR